MSRTRLICALAGALSAVALAAGPAQAEQVIVVSGHHAVKTDDPAVPSKAETYMRGSLAARRSIAPASSFHSTFPGNVVPPPARARRDNRPAARASAATSSNAPGPVTRGPSRA